MRRVRTRFRPSAWCRDASSGKAFRPVRNTCSPSDSRPRARYRSARLTRAGVKDGSRRSAACSSLSARGASPRYCQTSAMLARASARSALLICTCRYSSMPCSSSLLLRGLQLSGWQGEQKADHRHAYGTHRIIEHRSGRGPAPFRRHAGESLQGTDAHQRVRIIQAAVQRSQSVPATATATVRPVR
jgi:bisphosphoglycerate-dependent phosphoglycerate mutase